MAIANPEAATQTAMVSLREVIEWVLPVGGAASRGWVGGGDGGFGGVGGVVPVLREGGAFAIPFFIGASPTTTESTFATTRFISDITELVMFFRALA